MSVKDLNDHKFGPPLGEEADVELDVAMRSVVAALARAHEIARAYNGGGHEATLDTLIPLARLILDSAARSKT